MKQMFFLEFACFFYDPMDVCNLISSSSAFSQSSLYIWKFSVHILLKPAAATAKSLQLCPTVCDPTDGSPPGSSVPEILQARTLEWVAISFSNAWKWKVKVKSLNRVQLFATPWTIADQAPPSMGFSRQEYWSGVSLPSLKSRLVTFLKPRDNFWYKDIPWRNFLAVQCLRSLTSNAGAPVLSLVVELIFYKLYRVAKKKKKIPGRKLSS